MGPHPVGDEVEECKIVDEVEEHRGRLFFLHLEVWADAAAVAYGPPAGGVEDGREAVGYGRD